MEEQIIEQILAGDREAFRELVEAYQGPVFHLVRSIVSDWIECEDVAQDVFVTAFRRLHRYDRRKGRMLTWLLTIARNLAINAVKKRRPRTGEVFPIPLDCLQPDERQHAREAREALEAALQQLPLPRRTAFVLTELQGLSYEETSRIEQVAIGTIKSRVARARQQLQRLLKPLLEP